MFFLGQPVAMAILPAQNKQHENRIQFAPAVWCSGCLLYGIDRHHRKRVKDTRNPTVKSKKPDKAIKHFGALL